MYCRIIDEINCMKYNNSKYVLGDTLSAVLYWLLKVQWCK